MALYNTAKGYGAATKALHWLMVLLLLAQFSLAWTMVRTTPDGQTLGLGQAVLYNWHKSLGLFALCVACVRLWNRQQGSLPPWAKGLTKAEQMLIHRYEQALYALMFIVPISGFVYVMAGGYGVHLFGLWHLPAVLPQWGPLAVAAQWTHILSNIALILAIATHVGLVLRHQLLLKDGLLRRML